MNEINPEVFIGKDSGFISYRSHALSLSLNVGFHQNLDGCESDPRLVGGIPFWINYSTNSLIPPPPYTHGSTTSGSKKIPFSTSIGSILDNIYKLRKNIPISSGFLPYLIKNNSIYVFQGASEWESHKLNTVFKVEMKGPLWKFNMNRWNIIKNANKIVLNAWIKTNNRITYENIFNKTNIINNRKILIDTNNVYIEDSFIDIPDKKFKVIPFTIRTYDNVEYIEEDSYVIFKNSFNSNVIVVSKMKGEELIRASRLNSSAGHVRLWKFNNNNNLRNLKRLISIGDRDFLKKVDRQFFVDNIYRFKSMT